MYKLSVLLCLLSMSTSFSQINVRNSNYIFVKNDVLFVNDNINLQEADSKIYFRNDAQLIQGVGTTGNSGIGELSIYQNGTTHNYAYNYWCSPVGNNSVLIGNEDFTVNLFDDATGLITSNDVTFTLYNGTTSPLVIASYWVYTFENATQYSEWMYRGDTGAISPGLGFTMKGTSGSGNNQLYDFRGKPNNSTITNSVSAGEWTLVGNPYPSALDAVAFIHDVDNVSSITGTLYYWEQDLSVLSHNVADYVGGYATYTINNTGTVETFIPATFDTYNSDGSLNTTGSSSSSGKQAHRYIAIGQGFMVEGNSGTTGAVRAKNAHRIYYKESGSNSVFFRAGDLDDDSTSFIENDNQTFTIESHPYGLLPSDYKRFRINVDFNNVYTRQLVQTFHDTEATYGFDYGLESKSPSDVSNDAYWFANNESFVAQALPFDVAMSIPLHIRLNANNTIRVRIFDVQHFDTNQEIFVYDNENETYTNIRETPFEIALPQGDYTNRFEIVFAESVLGVENQDFNEINVFQNSKELIIDNPKLKLIKSIYLYDALGRLIWSNEKLTLNNEYVIDTSSLSSSLYILKFITEEKNIFSKKVIINN